MIHFQQEQIGFIIIFEKNIYFQTIIHRWTHLTGRKCRCGGNLKDTIVHFTENMLPEEWNLAVKNARKADVSLVLGTSMNVQAAASLPDKSLKNLNGKV